jgi:hypothetical protein
VDQVKMSKSEKVKEEMKVKTDFEKKMIYKLEK